jgi:hypothetical protein
MDPPEAAQFIDATADDEMGLMFRVAAARSCKDAGADQELRMREVGLADKSVNDR